MRILFVGHTWKGSSARSLCEALEKIPEVFIDEVGEDHFLPRYRSRILRIFNRILNFWQVSDLAREVSAKMDALKPDALIIYKGFGVRTNLIEEAKACSILTVNVFPDLSPHTHGPTLRQTMGMYDLVISTKPFHPDGWQSIYGYTNKCVCVPHGYDPSVHYWAAPQTEHNFDVVLAASWRPEYHDLMLGFSQAIKGANVRVGLAGNGWLEHRHQLPSNWEIDGPLYGRAYGDWVRRGKIVIAPVHTQVQIDGVRQPGDEDTTRTYELAAAYCFFLHRRTPFVETVYDEDTEVPMWSTPEELAQKVLHYLPLESERQTMAKAAHERAVPSYSIPGRAEQVLQHIRQAIADRAGDTHS